MAGRLEGRRILVLRPEGQAEHLARALGEEGADPVLAPAIRILPPADWGPIDAALGREHDWTVFTSVNGVAALRGRLPAGGLGRVAAVGPATARALEGEGLSVSFIPRAYTTEALGRELPGPPATVCLVRADIAGGDLEQILAQRGFAIDRIDAYRTEPQEPDRIAGALADGVDAVALTSASITEAFAAAAGDPPELRGATVVSIGPATTAAARRAGLAVAAEASPHTIPGLVAAMVATLGPRRGGQTAGGGPAAAGGSPGTMGP